MVRILYRQGHFKILKACKVYILHAFFMVRKFIRFFIVSKSSVFKGDLGSNPIMDLLSFTILFQILNFRFSSQLEFYAMFAHLVFSLPITFWRYTQVGIKKA
jgi:hypothetical protein